MTQDREESGRYFVINTSAILNQTSGVVDWCVIKDHWQWERFEKTFQPRTQAIGEDGDTASASITNSVNLAKNKYIVFLSPPGMPSDTIMAGAYDMDDENKMTLFIGWYSPERAEELGLLTNSQHAGFNQRHAFFIIYGRDKPMIEDVEFIFCGDRVPANADLTEELDLSAIAPGAKFAIIPGSGSEPE